MLESFNRKEKNKIYACIIKNNFLVKDFYLYCEKHQKIKSAYKLAQLFFKVHKVSDFDIQQAIAFLQRHGFDGALTCESIVKYNQDYVDELIKIAKFDWLNYEL